MSHVTSVNELSGNLTAADVFASVADGSNERMGLSAAMTAGTVTVNNTLVTANSRIFLTPQGTGGTGGSVSVSARSNGTSFTILSTSNTDTRTVAWLILEPAV